MSKNHKNKKEIREAVLPPCRLSISELIAIKEKAAKSDLSLSEYVRRCCLGARVVVRKSKADIEFMSELKRQGSNFNQYQHKLNALGKDTPEGVEEVSLRIETLLKRMGE